MFRLRIFSPNASCAPLRSIPFNQRVLLRLGSTTPLVSKYKYLELNTINGVKTSANKITMKKAFDAAKISHSEWITSKNINDIRKFFHIHKILIAKHRNSSQGKNIYYVDNIQSLENLFTTINIKDFVFEKYYFYSLEYRVHIDVNHGCFYACRKVLKDDADIQWHKHANNSIFVLVTKEHILPECWEKMILECIKALKQMQLTIACFDILCSNDRYIILESNTAPSLASYGITYYGNHLKKYYDFRF
ncbi:MAG: hypothetical protein RRZ84_07795 [Romboutsia sp.]